MQTHSILSLCARKPSLVVTANYTDAVGGQSVRTLSSVMPPERVDSGGWSVRAIDAELDKWRRFSVERLELLSVWDQAADGEYVIVDPAKLVAYAVAVRLASTLERVTTTTNLDAETTSYLCAALDDARRIAGVLR